VIEELVFVIETDDFPAVLAGMQRYGGRTPMVSSGKDQALFSLSSGILLRLQLAGKEDWGFQMVACTGSKAHLKKLTDVTGPLRDVKATKFKSEAALYISSLFSCQRPSSLLRAGVEAARKVWIADVEAAKQVVVLGL